MYVDTSNKIKLLKIVWILEYAQALRFVHLVKTGMKP